MAYVRKDHFHKKAKQDGLRSRAAYKLQELHKRFRLFPQGGRVLDLGAAPGGWLQVASRLVGKRGRVVGVDLLEIEPLPQKNIFLLQGDLLDQAIRKETLEILGGKADCVLCDMAPNISGIRLTDCVRSLALAEIALGMARECLRPGGCFVVKVFPGDSFDEFLFQLKRLFHKVKTTRPEATRKTSSEVYVLGLKLRETPLPS